MNNKLNYSKSELKRSGIYLITCFGDKDKYYYIGSTKTFNKRFSSHKTTLKHNCHKNIYLQRVVNKYNNYKIKIIQYVNNLDDLLKYEQKWLNIFINAGKKVLNLDTTIDKSNKQLNTRKHIKNIDEGILLKNNKKPTPVMINLETGHRIESMDSFEDLATILDCCSNSIRAYLKKKCNFVKGYVTEEHYISKEVYRDLDVAYQKGVECKQKISPKLYNLKTGEVTPEYPSRLHLLKTIPLSQRSLTRLISGESKIVNNWCLYNPEIHILEIDCEYE